MSNYAYIKHIKLYPNKDEERMPFGNVIFFNDESSNEPKISALDEQLKEAAKIIRGEENTDEAYPVLNEFVTPQTSTNASLSDNYISDEQANITEEAIEEHNPELDLSNIENVDNPVDMVDTFEVNTTTVITEDDENESINATEIVEDEQIFSGTTINLDRLVTEENDVDVDETQQNIAFFEDTAASPEDPLEAAKSRLIDNSDDIDQGIADAETFERTHAQAVMPEENRQQDDLDHATLPKIGKVGRLLLGLGKITAKDTKRILSEQKRSGLLFGDAALKLGLISQSDIQQVVALQFNYNYLQAGQGNFHDDLISVYTPFIKKAEAYRALRSQLMMKWFKKGNRVLAIGSANRQEGVSYLTANLGVVFAQLGARTLIIEANMRTPRQHAIFNPYDNVGLSDVLVGRANTEQAIKDVLNIPDLSLLTAGTVPPNPQELLGRTSFNILIKTLKDQFDVILIDTPAATESADAQSAFELAQGVLLVSRLDHTRHDDVINVTNQIEMSEAILVGAVMNEF